MKRIDHAGQHFGKLTAICRAETVKGHAKWKCRCECGNEVIVDAGNLRSGHTKSCGHCERYRYIDDKTVQCDLPTGEFFLIDAADYPEVSKHKWSIENSGYVHTMVNGKHVRLHNYLIGKTDGVIDHINCIRHDNRRCNLRICSNKENVRNQRLCVRNTSGFKGVSFDKRRGKYEARITVDGCSRFLGYYVDLSDAALAYDRAASHYFGEYARTNYMEGVKSEEILELDQKPRHGAA